jgi:glutamate-1-semialdehyde 2,1-aminomutase
MAAGIATLKLLKKEGFYTQLNDKAAGFAERLRELSERTQIPVCLNRVGSLMTGFFTTEVVVDFSTAMTADTERYGQHYRQMLSQGVYLAPSQFELLFISAAQSEKQLDRALEMTEWSFKKIARK